MVLSKSRMRRRRKKWKKEFLNSSNFSTLIVQKKSVTLNVYSLIHLCIHVLYKQIQILLVKFIFETRQLSNPKQANQFIDYRQQK